MSILFLKQSTGSETMKSFIIEKNTFLFWRIIQISIFFGILILEIVQLVGFSNYYLNYPANDQVQIWISEIISFIIIAYILINFNRRWKTGPIKRDVFLDWILLIVWNLQFFSNLFPAILGRGLDCNIETSPYQIITYNEQKRCRLFIVSTALSFVALSTTFIILIFSIARWKNRQFILSSINSHNIGSQKSYLIQEGSLDNGEPVLLFYSKNKSLNNNNSIHGNIIRHHPIAKIARTSTLSSPISNTPINISISEPEMAAAAALKSDDIPNVNVYDEEKNEDGKDNSVLRY